MATLKDALLNALREKFGFEITEWREIERPFQYPIITASVTDSKGKRHFLKESKEYTKASDLDQIYRELEFLRHRNPRLVCLPYRARSGEYSILVNGKTFHVFDEIDLRDLNRNEISYETLKDAISQLHLAIQGIQLPGSDGNPFRSLSTWLERPLEYLPQRFGSKLPFVDSYRKLLHGKFQKVQFQQANMHWDISPENVCIDKSGSLFFIDLEMAHKGSVIFDFIRAASIYLDFIQEKITLPPAIMSDLLKMGDRLADGIDEEILRFLLARCVVRNIRGGLMPNQKEEVPPFLAALEDFSRGKN